MPARGGRLLKGEFSASVCGPKQYGENLQAFAVALATAGAVSLERTSALICGFFGLSVTPAAVWGMTQRAARNTADAFEAIRQALKKRDAVHFDETGIRIGGRMPPATAGSRLSPLHPKGEVKAWTLQESFQTLREQRFMTAGVLISNIQKRAMPSAELILSGSLRA